jgi:hypothetical protein
MWYGTIGVCDSRTAAIRYSVRRLAHSKAGECSATVVVQWSQEAHTDGHRRAAPFVVPVGQVAKFGHRPCSVSESAPPIRRNNVAVFFFAKKYLKID